MMMLYSNNMGLKQNIIVNEMLKSLLNIKKLRKIKNNIK